ARPKLTISSNGLREALSSKFFTMRVIRLSDAICIKHKHIAGFSSQVILMITSISEHSQRYAAPIDKAQLAILFQQDRRIVPGIRIGQSFVRDVENAVDSSYKLIALDRFPEQIVYLRHRDVWRIADMCRLAGWRAETPLAKPPARPCRTHPL